MRLYRVVARQGGRSQKPGFLCTRHLKDQPDPTPWNSTLPTTSPHLESDVEKVRSSDKWGVLRRKNTFPPNQLHGTRDDLPPATRRAMNSAQRVIVVIIYCLEHHREEVGFGYVDVRLVCTEISVGVS